MRSVVLERRRQREGEVKVAGVGPRKKGVLPVEGGGERGEAGLVQAPDMLFFGCRCAK